MVIECIPMKSVNHRLTMIQNNSISSISIQGNFIPRLDFERISMSFSCKSSTVFQQYITLICIKPSIHRLAIIFIFDCIDFTGISKWKCDEM